MSFMYSALLTVTDNSNVIAFSITASLRILLIFAFTAAVIEIYNTVSVRKENSKPKLQSSYEDALVTSRS